MIELLRQQRNEAQDRAAMVLVDANYQMTALQARVKALEDMLGKIAPPPPLQEMLNAAAAAPPPVPFKPTVVAPQAPPKVNGPAPADVPDVPA